LARRRGKAWRLVSLGTILRVRFAALHEGGCHFSGVWVARSVLTSPSMSKLLRGVAAGWGAKKLGGGCFSTIIVFVLLWYLLGHFQIFR
jgi:hypothetical protein